MEVARLTTVLDVKDELTAGLRKGAAGAGLFSSSVTASLTAVAGAATAVTGTVMAAAQVLDNALDSIRIRTGATGKALAGLQTDFSKAFTAGPSGASAASDAIATLNARTRLAGQPLQNLATQILTVSRITETDLNKNLEGSTELFRSWGVAMGRQTGALDTVFRAAQATGTGFDTLLGSLVTAGPTMRALGLDMGTSAALLGSFAREGVDAGKVTAGLTTAVRNLAKAGAEPGPALQAVIARIRELGPSAEATALGVKVFGRSAVQMVDAIQRGTIDVRALVAQINSGTETIAGAARATDGFAETLAILRNRATSALAALGTPILDGLNRAMLALMENTHLVGAALAVVSSVALGRLVPALAASAAAAVAQGVALLTMATRAGIATAAMTGLRGALAFLGGPWGVAAIAVLSAVGLAFVEFGRRARQAAQDAQAAVDRVVSSVSRMDAATLARSADTARDNIRVLETQFETQRRLVEAQQRITERLRVPMPSAAAIGRGVPLSEEQEAYRLAQRRLELQTAQLHLYREQANEQRRILNIHKQEQANRVVPPLPPIPTVSVPDFGSGNASADVQRDADLLRQRVGLLVEVHNAERQMGRNSTSVASALVDASRDATARLAALGNAAALSPELLQDYANLQAIVRDLAHLPGVGTKVELAGFSEKLVSIMKGASERLRQGMLSAADEMQARISKIKAISRPPVGERPTLGTAAAAVILQRASTLPGADSFMDGFRAVEAALGSVTLGISFGGGRVADALQRVGAEVLDRGADLAARAGELLQPLRDAVARAAASLGDALRPLGDAVKGMLPTVSVSVGGPALGAAAAGAGLMVLSEALAGVMSTIGPALQSLLAPVRLVGEMLGGLLLPVIKLLFQPLRLLGIAVTYLQGAIGWAVRGIGKLIDALPFVSGGPIIRAGQELLDGAEAVRKRLEDMSFDDAMNDAANSARKLSESLSNVPEVFDLAMRRMQAARSVSLPTAPVPAAPTPAPRPPSAGPNGGAGGARPSGETTMSVQMSFGPGSLVVHAQPNHSEAEIARQLVAQLEKAGSTGGPSRLSLAVRRLATAQ